jgi:LPXTG-motif cell wall-anchored protein
LAEKRAAFQVTDAGIEILSEVPAEGKPVNWLMVGGIAGGVVAAGLIAFFVRRRRRYA